MRAVLKYMVPQFILNGYRWVKRQRRAAQLRNDKKNGQILSSAKITETLYQYGIVAGDVVMLHSSLSKLGFVEGGANAVIEGFLKALGGTGTLAMPSFPAMGFNADYLKQHPVFNVQQTPSRMGSITETFRQRTGVIRSWHPTEPVCAWGKHAVYLTEAHHLHETPYHQQSPFYRLCELNAKIILMGVDFNALTNLHTLEDAVNKFKYPVYAPERIPCRIIYPQGEITYQAAYHNPVWSKKRQCNALIEGFKTGGFLKIGIMGKATCYIIEAKAMHQWMLTNYIEKGITMYTPNGETLL